jgi:co-chaperonin GroES (HSP10)
MARSNAIGKMRAIAEDITDPKQVLLKALGKHQTTVLHSQVLVAGYVRPARTASGLWLTDKTIEEDRFQGNIGMVIALGKGAFKDDAVAKFHGDKLEVGDWVMYVPADGIALFINEVPCRLFSDTRILMKVTNPEIYY